MIIRDIQMCALQAACLRGFENRMTERVQRYFPRHAEQLDLQQQHTLVQLGITRARAHNLTYERSIALYLDLMCLLGSGFDADPQFPWAADALTDDSLRTQEARINSLSDRGWEYWGEISGEFESSIRQARGPAPIVALGEIGYQSLNELEPHSADDAVVGAVAELQMLFPVKCRLIGEECCVRLVQKAFQTALAYRIRSHRGCRLFATLMFVLGASFDCDPLFPWAWQALRGDVSADLAERANRLYAGASSALKQRYVAAAPAEI